MKHYVERIPAWLAGQLDADEAAALERHLNQCAECAEEAAQQRAIWDALGEANAADALTGAPSVWPAVRERTFARGEAAAWFFGSSLAVRGALAACALAAGLLFSAFLPGGGVADKALASDDLENFWFEDSSFADSETAYDLDGVWLAAGLEEEG